MKMIKNVEIKDKFCLTITEAAAYFNVGEKKLRAIIDAHIGADFYLMNGVKVLIKRQKFEKFLEQTSSI